MSGPHLKALPFSRWLAGWLILSLGIHQAHAADPVIAGSTVPSDPVFSALRTNGSSVSGRIKQLGPHGDVVLVPLKGPEETIPFRELVKLTKEGPIPAFTPAGSLVFFPNGDRLYRTVIGAASETSLDVQSYALEHLSVPLDSILGLVLNLPEEASLVDPLIERVRNEPRTTEVLWLGNGDKVTGGFLGLDEKKVKIQVGTGPLALDRIGVVAIGFDPALVAYPEPQGEAFDLTMSDGSRLGVHGAKIEQGQIVATTRFGAALRVPLSELVRIHTRSSSIYYLAEKPESAVRYVGYVGPTRPYRRDTSVEGHPLRLAGQTYDRGLGTQSRTILAYRINPGDRRFQALVGLDDSAGPLGSVIFRVLLDGQEAFSTPAMSVRDTPRAIDVDLKDAKLLILVTEFGERGEVRDFADWVEARVLR